MAYSDNYPNGTKSGYDSWNDPDRRDYSPYGEERARRNAMAASEERDRVMSDYEAARERERQRQQTLQEQKTQQYNDDINKRKSFENYLERRTAVINYKADEKRNAYKNKSWFVRCIATLSGKGFYKTPFWEQAKEEVVQMSEREVDEFYRKNIR